MPVQTRPHAMGEGKLPEGKLRNQQRVTKTTDVITREWAMEKRKRMLDRDVLQRFLPIII